MPRLRLLIPLVVICTTAAAQSTSKKPALTIDDWFNSVEFPNLRISPDGSSVLIETKRADWQAERFRSDLWLFRAEGSSLVPLAHSGHDRRGEWSPDGKWIAFLSDRSTQGEGTADAANKLAQVYVVRVAGGEAFAATRSEEEIHAFAWAADSRVIYVATRQPWSKEQREAYQTEWHDVMQFREAERGDAVSRIAVAEALHCAGGPKACDSSGGIKAITTTPFRVVQLECSPDGNQLAFLTEPASERQETLNPYGLYVLSPAGGQPRALLEGQAAIDVIRWAHDGRHIFFSFPEGSSQSIGGAFPDAQPRVYWLDAAVEKPLGTAVRWAASFQGAINGFAVSPDGRLLAAGMLGTETEVYAQDGPQRRFARQPGLPGRYQQIATSLHSPRIAFVHSSLQQPAEIYLAQSVAGLLHAHPITSFNRTLTERVLPEGRPYRWTADDGVPIEGMLIYPPGKSGAAHLPMLTSIHGGPDDADGNYLEADWYQWAALAATHGWLVFEPNYRGSIGYGDGFAHGYVPHAFSKPGRDILSGIDALVEQNIADPEHLAVGGYSYGGDLTNWLITQTTRFKAAVTGAGVVEHLVNWGNIDLPRWHAYILGGAPWEAKSNYDAESPILRIDQVTTPTHMVVGAADSRVFFGETYLLERALTTLGVPNKLLVFPGEGHDLDKNPWHGKIKVREELQWLEKYR